MRDGSALPQLSAMSEVRSLALPPAAGTGQHYAGGIFTAVLASELKRASIGVLRPRASTGSLTRHAPSLIVSVAFGGMMETVFGVAFVLSRTCSTGIWWISRGCQAGP